MKMDRAARIVIIAACKMLIDVINKCELSELEDKRVHAGYRRLMLALNTEQDK